MAQNPLPFRTRQTLIVFVSVGVGVTVGLVARGLFSPVVLDDPFWRAFWSGPPAAGLFALAGAGVAFAAARIAAKTARRGAERQEWWDRAEWALNLARADNSSDRVIGLQTLRALETQAALTESQMIVAVTEAVVGEGRSMDKASPAEENGIRRWWKWPKRSV